MISTSTSRLSLILALSMSVGACLDPDDRVPDTEPSDGDTDTDTDADSDSDADSDADTDSDSDTDTGEPMTLHVDAVSPSYGVAGAEVSFTGSFPHDTSFSLVLDSGERVLFDETVCNSPGPTCTAVTPFISADEIDYDGDGLPGFLRVEVEDTTAGGKILTGEIFQFWPSDYHIVGLFLSSSQTTHDYTYAEVTMVRSETAPTYIIENSGLPEGCTHYSDTEIDDLFWYPSSIVRDGGTHEASVPDVTLSVSGGSTAFELPRNSSGNNLWNYSGTTTMSLGVSYELVNPGSDSWPVFNVAEAFETPGAVVGAHAEFDFVGDPEYPNIVVTWTAGTDPEAMVLVAAGHTYDGDGANQEMLFCWTGDTGLYTIDGTSFMQPWDEDGGTYHSDALGVMLYRVITTDNMVPGTGTATRLTGAYLAMADGDMYYGSE